MSNRQLHILIALIVVLALGCAWLVPWPARAAAPSLTIFSANDRGVVDLLPGGRVQIVIELRSDDLQTAAIAHLTPAGFTVESARASSGKLVLFHDTVLQGATPAMLVWNGDVAAAQPVNIVINYRVDQATAPGDRLASASGQAGAVQLAASTAVRVCCITSAAPRPPPGTRVYLAVLRH